MRKGHAKLRQGAFLLLIALLPALVTIACGGDSGTTNTSEPTRTPEPTNTPKPADTVTARLATATPVSGRISALVVQVIDGDTIEVEIEGQRYKVRYIGMDTPERGELFFEEATEANRQLVEGQTVKLEKDVSETDKYGRLLRYVYIGDIFVNAELVRQGYAQTATFPPDVRHQELFQSLERAARETGRGLWGQPERTSTPSLAPTPTPMLTTTPSLTSTPQPAPTETPAPAGSLRLGEAFYDGEVAFVESDEFIEIANDGPPINLLGWVLRDDNGNKFVFPDFEMATGQRCRVYTNEDHTEHCGFNFGHDEAIWGNSGDIVELVDPAGNVVDRDCWGTGC